MHIAFQLSMPGNNAWNGRWSGENDLYVRVLTVSDAQKTREKFEKLIGYHTYNFGDGWRAGIEVKEVTGAEKRQLVKKSKGFCGYEWMIDSLRYHGKIDPDARLTQSAKEVSKP
jgi:hypothetical protein